MPNMYRIGVTLALAGFIFAVDLVLPLGVAIGVPYVAVVFMAVRSVQVKNGLWVTGICSILILLGYTLSAKDGPVWRSLSSCLEYNHGYTELQCPRLTRRAGT